MLKAYVIKAQSTKPNSTRYVKFEEDTKTGFLEPIFVENALEAAEIDPKDIYRNWELLRNIKWNTIANALAGVVPDGATETVKFQLYVIYSDLTLAAYHSINADCFEFFDVVITTIDKVAFARHGSFSSANNQTNILRMDAAELTVHFKGDNGS